MKYIIRIAAALAAFMIMTSCAKDDTIRYNNITLGNFVGDKFVSDQGNEFTIVENMTGEKFDGIKRAIMQCDVLSKVQGTENGYEVRVHYVGEVLTKSPVETAVAAADPEKIVEDPIKIEDAWISGGYLNMYVMFEVQAYPQKEDSKHMVNIVFTESEVGSGKYNLTLRHNSFGETLAPAEDDSEDENGTEGSEGGDNSEDPEASSQMSVKATDLIQWGLSGAYVSFQLSDLIQEESAQIDLIWKEHVIIDNMWMAETHERKATLTYSKDSFEQTPLTLTTKSVVLK